jgi:hypothetical protein
MRTTLTVDDALMEDIRARAASAGVSLTEAVNRALRHGVCAIADGGPSSSDLRADAHRQSVAVAESIREPDDQAFIDAVTDFGDA